MSKLISVLHLVYPGFQRLFSRYEKSNYLANTSEPESQKEDPKGNSTTN